MNQTVIPQLRMTNPERSLSFYVSGLGFKVDWEHRFEAGFPLFTQITKQGQTIFLTEHTGDCQVGGAVYFLVPDAVECCGDFQRQGITPTNPPSETSWGTCEFLLTDPDGNRLRFASELQVTSSASPELAALRQKIDRIDSSLVELLAARFKITDQVGVLKKQQDLPAIDHVRELAQEQKIELLAQQHGLSRDVARSVLRIVIDEVVRNHQLKK